MVVGNRSESMDGRVVIKDRSERLEINLRPIGHETQDQLTLMQNRSKDGDELLLCDRRYIIKLCIYFSKMKIF